MNALGAEPRDEAQMRQLALGFSAARAAIGALAVLAPHTGSRIFGFPDAHDNATARLVARLFGIRELALAAYTAEQVRRDPRQPDLYLANAAVDGGDLTVCLLTFLGRRGVARAALGSAALAAPFTATWLWLRGSCQA